MEQRVVDERPAAHYTECEHWDQQSLTTPIHTQSDLLSPSTDTLNLMKTWGVSDLEFEMMMMMMMSDHTNNSQGPFVCHSHPYMWLHD